MSRRKGPHIQPTDPLETKSPPPESQLPCHDSTQSVKTMPTCDRFERFIGMDIHKEYLTIVALDRSQTVLLSIKRMAWSTFEAWAHKQLNQRDAVVIEMTTNTYTVYDFLVKIVGLVKVVHPPNVTDMMGKGAKTDTRDAHELARLLMSGLLDDEGVWIPPPPVRELRTLVAQRHKLVRLQTKAKNRLHNVLHRHHLARPEGSVPFADKHADFWLKLPGLSMAERTEVQVQWRTLQFVEEEIKLIEAALAEAGGREPAVQLLIQLPGLGLINAITIIAAIGDITRFKKARQFVRYTGLDSVTQQSGDHLWQGPISKAGRKDLRYALVDAATHAAKHHTYWKREFARLEHKGSGKAYVAIARRLAVVIWHLLTDVVADKHADHQQVAQGYYSFYYAVGQEHLPGQPKPLQYVREQLDELGIGIEVTQIKNGRKRYALPPSRLDPNATIEALEWTYRFGCASLPQTPDPRTRAERVKAGRSSPDGPLKKRKPKTVIQPVDG